MNAAPATPRRPREEAPNVPDAPRKQKRFADFTTGAPVAVRDLTGQFNIIAAQKTRMDEKD